MLWSLIGYCPKRRTRRSDWVSPYPDYPDATFPASPPVEEICSVSNCIAKGPPGWQEHLTYKFLDMFGNPEMAWSISASPKK